MSQAYRIRCVYNTGTQDISIGFNVSMLTTSGTIANTGPPPTCSMRICNSNGNDISSAEIGDNLMLKVDVQPNAIYGGFARRCVATTMGDDGENEYLVTDDNGCATDPSIFGEWQYERNLGVLTASFNAFKFPASNNIRFQCNIRVCFGQCQPQNCAGSNAYGRRRRDPDIALEPDVVARRELECIEARCEDPQVPLVLPLSKDGRVRSTPVIISHQVLVFTIIAHGGSNTASCKASINGIWLYVHLQHQIVANFSAGDVVAIGVADAHATRRRWSRVGNCAGCRQH